MYALEFVLSLCESASEMLRKHMDTIERVMHLAAQFACHVADDPAWAGKEDDFTNTQGFADDATDDATAMTALGDDALDRIARAIGGRLCVRSCLWMRCGMAGRVCACAGVREGARVSGVGAVRGVGSHPFRGGHGFHARAQVLAGGDLS